MKNFPGNAPGKKKGRSIANGPSLGRKRPRRAAKREHSSHIALQKVTVHRITSNPILCMTEGRKTQILHSSFAARIRIKKGRS
jgi:hypothetical protein